ncbi:MAG: hypothetical protein ACK4SO_05160 [Candidatus Kapaibacteriota bacterium]
MAITQKLIIEERINKQVEKKINKQEIKEQTNWQTSLKHQQEIWISALEWCESRGIKEAINPRDKDGTPSWYSFQFKPETFRYYAIKYGLLSKEITLTETMEKMENYDLQREIIRRMVSDRNIKWDQEFPSCFKKIGPPPNMT